MDRKDGPYFSVVVACYNGGAYLPETLDSILAQTFSDFELIYIDDCSTDNSLDIAKSYAKKDSRIIILENERNSGVANSRNKGFAQAKGQYVCPCDADDLWAANKLELQYGHIGKTGCELCYTGYAFVDGNTNPIKNPYHVPETIDYRGLLKENVIGLSTVALHARWAKKYKMDGAFSHEDFAYWLLLLRGGVKASGIDAPLMRYRISGSNRSANKLKAAQNRYKILRVQENMGPIRSLRYIGAYTWRALRKYR